MKRAHAIIELAELWLVPAIFAGYLLFYIIDGAAYYQSLREDRIVEWATFFCLVVTGVVSLVAGGRHRRTGDRRAWFLLVLGVACLLSAFEEISWGQRIVGLESPEYFLEHSDQQEINIHNVLQKSWGFYLKDIVGLGFVIYGIVIPLLDRRSAWRGIFARWGVAVPPIVLIPSWFLAAVLIIDWPTGEEEELGEMLFAVCLLLVAAGQFVQAGARKRREA